MRGWGIASPRGPGRAGGWFATWSDRVDDPYLLKAERSLLGAESEYAAGRYENVANRCYYACFQAAIAGLRRHGIRPSVDQWGHDFVQSRFVGQLVNRRHRYPAALRTMLTDLRVLRQRADYETDPISQVEAARGLRKARLVVAAVAEEGASPR